MAISQSQEKKSKHDSRPTRICIGNQENSLHLTHRTSESPRHFPGASLRSEKRVQRGENYSLSWNLAELRGKTFARPTYPSAIRQIRQANVARELEKTTVWLYLIHVRFDLITNGKTKTTGSIVAFSLWIRIKMRTWCTCLAIVTSPVNFSFATTFYFNSLARLSWLPRIPFSCSLLTSSFRRHRVPFDFATLPRSLQATSGNQMTTVCLVDDSREPNSRQTACIKITVTVHICFAHPHFFIIQIITVNNNDDNFSTAQKKRTRLIRYTIRQWMSGLLRFARYKLAEDKFGGRAESEEKFNIVLTVKLRSGFVSLGFIVPGYSFFVLVVCVCLAQNGRHERAGYVRVRKRERTRRKSPIAIGYGFYFLSALSKKNQRTRRR